MASIKQRLQLLLGAAAAGQAPPQVCCSAPLQRTTTELEVIGLGRLKPPMEESRLEQLQALAEPLGTRCRRLDGSKVAILNKSEVQKTLSARRQRHAGRQPRGCPPPPGPCAWARLW